MDHHTSAIVLLWSVIGIVLGFLLWPGGKGRRLARQIFAVAVLGFREGLRLKILWTVVVLGLIPGILAYLSDADGTHAGRARLVLNYTLASGEFFGAVLIVLLSALSVAREIESRIMHTFGTKPVPRWAILTGKALGFWALDLLFLGIICLTSLLLVRAVPMRPESRSQDKLVQSGTWEDLSRNVLTTRTFQDADSESGMKYKMIKPDSSYTWLFTMDPERSKGEDVALRFGLSSTQTFASHIEDLGIRVAYTDTPEPLIHFDKKTVPQDRPFDLFIAGKDIRAGTIAVSLRAPKKYAYSPSVVGAVRAALPADGVLINVFKAFLLMALQGWILAFITTCWSGVLSFPVTVAMGIILLLGGEMSRHALELLQVGAAHARDMAAAGTGAGMSEEITAQLRILLSLLPDFRAGGGPTAFVEGTYVSGWALAHTVFSMGIFRTLGWAIPGVMLFNRREVGR